MISPTILEAVQGFLRGDVSISHWMQSVCDCSVSRRTGCKTRKRGQQTGTSAPGTPLTASRCSTIGTRYLCSVFAALCLLVAADATNGRRKPGVMRRNSAAKMTACGNSSAASVNSVFLAGLQLDCRIWSHARSESTYTARHRKR